MSVWPGTASGSCQSCSTGTPQYAVSGYLALVAGPRPHRSDRSDRCGLLRLGRKVLSGHDHGCDHASDRQHLYGRMPTRSAVRLRPCRVVCNSSPSARHAARFLHRHRGGRRVAQSDVAMLQHRSSMINAATWCSLKSTIAVQRSTDSRYKQSKLCAPALNDIPEIRRARCLCRSTGITPHVRLLGTHALAVTRSAARRSEACNRVAVRADALPQRFPGVVTPRTHGRQHPQGNLAYGRQADRRHTWPCRTAAVPTSALRLPAPMRPTDMRATVEMDGQTHR
jgi:hypothetical protein